MCYNKKCLLEGVCMAIEELIMLYKLKKADLLAQNQKFHYMLDDYQKQENVYRLILEKNSDFK